VSRYAGTFEHVFDTEVAGELSHVCRLFLYDVQYLIAGVMIQAPQLDIHTVAAGGGSRLFFRSGLFVVGPESSSAHPGKKKQTK
jgi:5-oxoprolinase (ATP-hydrolysing)